MTHRLDQCTEGLLVLGKTREFVRQFMEMIKQGSSSSSSASSSGSEDDSSSQGGAAAHASSTASSSNRSSSSSSDEAKPSATRTLRKFYRAATSAPPPLGLLRHRLSVERRHQGLPFFTVAHGWEEEVEGSLTAELKVLETAPIR